ncbi:hypothetical protein ACJVC5_16300 [Peredibacter sp. HCB2-198]|uniref:hypothetical protein n=1 Tax=Peredibacter sp. HCB2-198 TaxID=3383025 RepID=UPI0038B5173B
MIETYWDEVFGEFKVGNREFDIPGFPEPLMSVHFGVRNVVGPTNKVFTQSFKLCVFPPASFEIRSKQETLNEAIHSSIFWEYQKQHNSNAVIFIERLLPFLAKLDTPHFHFYLEDQEGIYASAIVGVSKSSCFLFNLSVSERKRNQGVAKTILESIRGTFFDRPAFYWTVHPWFTFDAKTEDYHILK